MAVSTRPSRSFPIWPAGLAALVCAAPLLAVAALAILGPWSDYLGHIAATRLPGYVLVTVIVTATAGFSAVSLGTPLAWLVARYGFWGRSALEWMVALPLAVPAYVAAYGWYDLTQAGGPLGPYLPTLRGPVGTGLALGFTLYPYVYLLARDAFMGQSSDAYEAARTLGQNPLGAFWRAALPMARPAIAAGLALVIMESLADYGAAVHLGAQTLSVGLIRAWAGEGATAEAARLALLLVTIAFLMFALERQQRRRARQSNASGRQRGFKRVRLPALANVAAIPVCLIPILLGLVIPLARLAYLAGYAPAARDWAVGAQNSIFLAVISGIVAAGLGVCAAYALRSGKPFAVMSARLAGLGYAVPGSVAALGVLILLGALQTQIDSVWSGLFGTVFPVLFTGTVSALIFAYQSRFAAAAISPVDSALSRITPNLDGASRTLGATPSQTAWRVHRPLISGGVLLAGLLVFVEVLKELPATMILRPFNFETLGVIAHNYASDERLGEAALPASLIVLICLPVMVFIARHNTRTRP